MSTTPSFRQPLVALLAPVSLLALASLLLAACASGPVPPTWQANAHAALARYPAAYFSGERRLASADLALARRDVARTGRPDLLARVELSVCAVHIAALATLADDDCSPYQRFAVDASPDDQAYAQFLRGHWAGLDSGRLPESYRALLSAGDDAGAATAALAEIASPLSRLIAAGVLLRRAQLTPAGLELAIETASTQGWSRPLLAYLGVQLQTAEKASDSASSERIKRRINTISSRP
jgi:hypothetical protein